MAYGKKAGGNSDYKLLVFRLKNKDENSVELVPNLFQVSEKVNEEWTPKEDMVPNVSGNLTKVELDTKEYKGEPYKVVKLFLQDEDAKETYLIDLRYGRLTRNLFNSLLALETFDNLEISNYAKESKIDGKTYSNISLWQRAEGAEKGTLIKGKFTLADIPAAEEIKDRKGKVIKRNYEEVDDFFETHLKEFADKVNGKKTSKPATAPAPKAETPTEKTTSGKKTTKKTETPPPGDVNDEDVPFDSPR
jgi:hypothetical protein